MFKWIKMKYEQWLIRELEKRGLDICFEKASIKEMLEAKIEVDEEDLLQLREMNKELERYNGYLVEEIEKLKNTN